MSDTLDDIAQSAYTELRLHKAEFDAIVCGGDHHGIAVAAVIAADLKMPLMIVCMEQHSCVVSHITCIGEARPDHRYLYVDDWFSFGATRKFVFEYFAQSGEPVPVVATYAATIREYRRVTA